MPNQCYPSQKPQSKTTFRIRQDMQSVLKGRTCVLREQDADTHNHRPFRERNRERGREREMKGEGKSKNVIQPLKGRRKSGCEPSTDLWGGGGVSTIHKPVTSPFPSHYMKDPSHLNGFSFISQRIQPLMVYIQTDRREEALWDKAFGYITLNNSREWMNERRKEGQNEWINAWMKVWRKEGRN